MRPTGIVDPEIEVRETKNQIDDLMNEIKAPAEAGDRVLVTTLTKKMAEDLTDYLLEYGIKVRYLHSEIDTLERIQIVRDLRLGEYDVLVGVNLLREGLDLPEVSLVAILDADKEGFLRGETSLVQTIGRAARNVNGRVLMYADKETDAMRAAMQRDRPPPGDPARLQRGARDHPGDRPQGDLRDVRVPGDGGPGAANAAAARRGGEFADPEELERTIVSLEEEMLAAADDLRFEEAAPHPRRAQGAAPRPRRDDGGGLRPDPRRDGLRQDLRRLGAVGVELAADDLAVARTSSGGRTAPRSCRCRCPRAASPGRPPTRRRR